MPQASAPLYELLIIPFDAEFDFLEDVGRGAMAAYKDVIQSFKIMPRTDLPKKLMSVKDGDEEAEKFAQLINWNFKDLATDVLGHYNAGEKVIFIGDMVNAIPEYAVHNRPTIHLMIVPYFMYGDEMAQNGASFPKLRFAIMSTYGLDDTDAKGKTALREVGDVIAGKSSAE